MTANTAEQQLSLLPPPALQQLAEEFGQMAMFLGAPGAARWAAWWWWRCVRLMGLEPLGPEPARCGPETLSDGEAVVLRDRFGHHRFCCSPLPGMAAWCRQLVTDLVDDVDRRLYERARIDAEFQIVAAEENRRAREGRPAPDLRGLPTWKEISSPPPEQ